MVKVRLATAVSRHRNAKTAKTAVTPLAQRLLCPTVTLLNTQIVTILTL